MMKTKHMACDELGAAHPGLYWLHCWLHYWLHYWRYPAL
jgi:hypothetical protein